MVRRGDAVFAVDLWLDVLVRRDRVTHGVHDHDEFDEAITRGWLSEREQAGARAGLDELIDLIDRHALIDFLADLHPFLPADVPEALPMERVELSEAKRLRPGARARGERREVREEACAEVTSSTLGRALDLIPRYRVYR
jgi:hypothetical protein